MEIGREVLTRGLAETVQKIYCERILLSPWNQDAGIFLSVFQTVFESCLACTKEARI